MLVVHGRKVRVASELDRHGRAIVISDNDAQNTTDLNKQMTYRTPEFGRAIVVKRAEINQLARALEFDCAQVNVSCWMRGCRK